MNTFYAISTECPVTDMPHQEFSYIRDPLLLKLHIVLDRRVFLKLFIDPGVDLVKDVLDWLRIIGPDPTYVSLPGSYIHLNAGKTRSVLTAVVLLLHHQIHLIDSVEGCPVFLLVILKRFSESDQGNSAFVL